MHVQITSFKMKMFVESSILWDKSENTKKRETR